MAIASAYPNRPALSPLLALAASILGLALYVNVLGSDLSGTDNKLTAANQQVNRRARPSVIWLEPTPAQTSEPVYRPVLALLLRLEWKLWGNSPSSFHAFNVFLFIGCVFALMLLAGRLTAHPEVDGFRSIDPPLTAQH